ncbi:hypothetical protein vseg_016033 [Gypsophila vaccaria]
MEADCVKYVKHCHNCQIFGNIQHVAPSPLYTLTSPCPFSTWGIDVVGKIHPIGAGGHCFILVAIIYFTKWVEAASFRTLGPKEVAKFIKLTSFADMVSRTNSSVIKEPISAGKLNPS